MKVIKEDNDSSNFLLLEQGKSIIASGPNSVSVTRDNGVFINGPVSFTSTVDSVKFAGTFRINPLAASGLPSTIVTPIPMFTIEPPIRVGAMGSVAKIAASLI